MTKTPWNRLGLVFVFLLIAGVIAPTLTVRTGRTDLTILSQAAERLAAHQPVYQMADANEHTKPPLATFLWLPLRGVEWGWHARAWDLLNLLLGGFLAFFFSSQWQKGTSLSKGGLALISLLFILNPWNQEIRLGQYNLVAFFLMLTSLWLPSFGAGGCAAIALLFKPSHLIFLPWAVKRASSPGEFFAGALALVLTASAFFAAQFGVSQWITDHQAWLEFLPLSTAKHLGRFDNYGLPHLLALSFGEAAWSQIFPAVGLAFSVAVTLKRGATWSTLSVLGVVAVLSTPMAWFQNYVLLLPWVVELVARATGTDKNGRLGGGLALACLYLGLQVFNPELWKYFPEVAFLPVPLVALVLAVGVSVVVQPRSE